MDILDKIKNVLVEDIEAVVMSFIDGMRVDTEEKLEDVVMGLEDRNPAAAKWLETNFEQFI